MRSGTATMAFMPREAARLADLPLSTLLRWRRLGWVGTATPVYLDFRDLLALRVASALRRQHRISWARVARVSAYLSEYKAKPLSELRIYVGAKRRLYFRNPKTGKLEDAEGRRQVHAEPGERFGLVAVEAELLRKVKQARQRPKSSHGKFERIRGVQGGAECISGTGIRVETVASWLHSGAKADEVLRNFPELVARDVQAVAASNLARAS